MKTTIRDFYVHAGNTFMTKVDKETKKHFTCTPLGTTYLYMQNIYGININLVCVFLQWKDLNE